MQNLHPFVSDFPLSAADLYTHISAHETCCELECRDERVREFLRPLEQLLRGLYRAWRRVSDRGGEAEPRQG